MNTRQILPPSYVLMALIIILVHYFISPGFKLIPLPWNLLSLTPLAIGVMLNLIADGAFRRAGTTIKPFQESSFLLTDGVFRFSRRPMYLGFVLILIGIAILLETLTPWVNDPHLCSADRGGVHPGRGADAGRKIWASLVGIQEKGPALDLELKRFDFITMCP